MGPTSPISGVTAADEDAGRGTLTSVSVVDHSEAVSEAAMLCLQSSQSRAVALRSRGAVDAVLLLYDDFEVRLLREKRDLSSTRDLDVAQAIKYEVSANRRRRSVLGKSYWRT